MKQLKLFILSLLFLSSSLFAFEFELSQEELQKGLDFKFPIEKSKFFQDFTLTNPKIELKNNSDKVFLRMNVNVKNKLGLNENFYVKLNSKIYFDTKTTDIYLRDFELESLENEKIPEKLRDSISKGIVFLVNERFENKPIYNLDSLKEKLVIMKFNIIKDIKIKEQKLVLTLGF